MDLQRSVELPIDLDDLSLEIAASVGIAVAAAARERAVGAAEACRCRYAHRQVLRRRVQVTDRDMDTHSLQRLGLARELRQAITEHHVEIYVQPQVVLPTGVVAGVEALARWNHPEMGWIPPGDFVAVAERSGLIRHLTSDIMRQAVAFAAGLEARGHEIGVSVNLSARNLNDLNLPAEIASLLDQHHLSAGRLTFEITESTVMADSGRHLDLLTELAAWACNCRSTTSGPATPPCPTSAACRCTRSRSTAPS
jgi:predicted signal transduction protein with EAL and GGDEF domain